jgi:Ca2+-binding RTX toxin-like protein
VLFGGSGNDQLFSFKGNDNLIGGSGRDVLWGGEDNDTLSGGSGNDELTGGTGDDLLIGGTGNDILIGDTGAFDDFGHDVLQGGYGDDNLTGGASGDVLTGGAGADTFVFHQGNSNIDDRDHITDFTGLDRTTSRCRTSAARTTRLRPRLPTASCTATARRPAPSGSHTGKQNQWHVVVNHDGGAPDMVIDVTLAGGLTTMTADHFLL